jgi:hypothetical protein
VDIGGGRTFDEARPIGMGRPKRWRGRIGYRRVDDTSAHHDEEEGG